MIRVGTSGWSYADWVGSFYPVQLRDRPDAWLAHYASRFRSVEVHSTFDAFPTEDLVAEWARAGVALSEREPFEFNLQLPRAITHDALLAGDVAAARELTGQFDREVLDPLAGEGLLGAVLVTLPPKLAPSDVAVAALHDVLGALVERPVAIAFRHPAWFHNGVVVSAADRLFASPYVALVEHDNPALPGALAPIGARHAYVRLHGRRHDWTLRANETPDAHRQAHLYSRDELRPFAERAALLEAAGKDVRVVFANTPGARACANALDLLDMLGQAPSVPRPKLTEQMKLR